MSRRRYFEEQRSGNGAIYHCVKTEIEPGDKIRLFNLMNKVKSDTISQDKINSVLNQLREGTAFNIHTQSPVSFGMRDLINNADEDVDCITSATEKSSMYRNDSFFVFV